MSEGIKAFRDRGGDVNKRNKNCDTLLLSYIKRSGAEPKLENIKYLIENGVDLNAKDNDGLNVLYYVISQVDLEYIFKYLLSKVSSVDEIILIDAIKFDQLNFVKEIVNKKHLTVDYVFSNGDTPLDLSWGRVKRYLRKKPDF